MPIFNFNQNGQVMIPLPVPIENGGTGAEDAATARANLGLGSAALLDFTLPLPINQGGTGSIAQNFVDITTNQSVAGNKIFSGTVTAKNLCGNGVTPAAVPGGFSLDYLNGLRLLGYYTDNTRRADFNFSAGNSAGGAALSWLQFFGITSTAAVNCPLNVTAQTASTSTTTGALVVSGGIGVGGNIYAVGDRIVFANLPTSSAGLPTGALWKNGNAINVA